MLRSRVSVAVVFLVLAFVVDRAVGGVLKALYERTETGDGAGQLRHALESRNSDALIFGTSRARHHVDPKVLRDSLGITAYNYGSNGRGIYYARIVERLVLARGTRARLFLLQAEPFDLYDIHPERASVCAPLVDEDAVAFDLLAHSTPFGSLKLLSRTYRYNSMVFPILANLSVRGASNAAGSGYVGLQNNLRGVDPGAPFDSPLRHYSGRTIDPRALQLYRDFVADARKADIGVVLFGGPWFRTTPPPLAEERAVQAFRDLARGENVLYLPLDERTYPLFTDPNLFADRDHLNAVGAAYLSNLLAEQLREVVSLRFPREHDTE